MDMNAQLLEERLINFAVMALNLTDELPKTYAGKHLGEQLTRSAISPALNYGEAQNAESPKSFTYKVKHCLKELKETQINLKIIERKAMLKPLSVNQTLQECNELVAIFTAIVKKRNAIL
jgi:four helix bundle protein